MISLVLKAAKEARDRNSKRITAVHLKQAVAKDEVLDFLADIIAKVGFSSLIHRTAVFQSRADEEASPTTQRRPRQPEADSLWVRDQARYEGDEDRPRR